MTYATYTQKSQNGKFTLKERLGIALERWILAILKVLFPSKLGYCILTPDYDNYNNHNGVDFRVFIRNREILAVECKNWRKIGRKYDSEIAQSEIVNRFNHVGTSLKLCVISFLDVLCGSGLSLIKANGITLIETNKVVGHRDYKSQLFYQIKLAIHKLVKQSARVSLCSTIQSNTITSYCSSSEYTNRKTTIPTTKNTIDIDNPILSSDPIVRLLQEVRRLKKLRDSFREHGIILD
jgi:hypothetical protein